MATSIKQKQWQLFFLGYYGESTADIDGIWGAKSKAGTVAFQKDVGIKDDGIFGISTENKSMEVVDNIQDVITAWPRNHGGNGLVPESKGTDPQRHSGFPNPYLHSQFHRHCDRHKCREQNRG